jgi:hypothetical protein
MNPRTKLAIVRTIHTIIWLFFASIVFYILYAGLSGRVTVFTWLSIFIILFEGLVLLIFGWSCPLTFIARQYSESRKANFDIFLPKWIAKNNKPIFTSLYVLGTVLVIYQSLR